MGKALELLAQALDLLDAADAPGEIGAHVDLARDRLSNVLDIAPPADAVIWAAFPKSAALKT
jgi:hypothetical protein